MGEILIVDDNEDLRFSLTAVVTREGYRAVTAATGAEAVEVMRSHIIDLVFLDIGLPDGNGMEMIGTLKSTTADADIVMLTGVNTAKTAVEALKAGAVDYIVKPFDILEFTTILNRIMQSRTMAKKALVGTPEKGLDAIICTSKAMARVKASIQSAAGVPVPVLITGKTGTGKELTAQAIHHACRSRNGVFVKVDCSTLSANLIESELFGHEKGAFTDARTAKKGLVEIADGGTLFLDEIGNLPLSLQPKLLRLLEESSFRKVGGLKDIKADLRIIAATNTDLKEETERGNFRDDLYYRLNVLPIALPPLKDRDGDVLLLADYFLHRFNRELKKNIQGFTPAATEHMLSYDWPGNIRELRNLVEREVIFCNTGWISMTGLKTSAVGGRGRKGRKNLPLKEIERRYIHKVLNSVNNNKSQAARILGISRTTLREKIQTGQFSAS